MLAAAAFVAGLLVANASGDAERQLATEYVSAWSHGNYARMYALLDTRSRGQLSEGRFVAKYQADARTGTLISVVPVRVGNPRANVIAVLMRARTRLFGTLRETLLVPFASSSSGPNVSFSGTLLFPGLLPGERLTRVAELPPRATLLARDGTPLAQGPGRSSPIPGVANEIVGVLGPIPADQATTYEAEGYPPSAKVGQDGLERVFERQLAGTPGATLMAGKRVLAAAAPVPGTTIKTTIDPALETAAISALGGRYGGIVAMDPRSGALLALAGVAFSALQPPGSTMKIITSTAALQAGIVKLGDVFPYGTSATIDGYTLQNANGEDCGGTFLNAFAVSCNSVFAPLGARLGAQRLVSMAERFGFNQSPTISGAAESEIPSASTIGDSLAVGSSAIGQGRVQASALEMTDVAATIAMGGRRPIPTLLDGQSPSFAPVTSHAIASLVQRMMVAVVTEGTGTAAAIPGVEVAGKTGTAELANTSTTNPNNQSNTTNTTQETDAWFVGYAPVGHPRIVAGALFPAQGAGGATAAPAAREVLLAGLQSH
ncbi:MAG TPA: penicillin-binding transpeptidase domain-containing protein [Solirubrobacteraceae bacterium]|nr:penicillin-binding transpeptidase domain-containing protein [Solirubrobacteraceae bacterium]